MQVKYVTALLVTLFTVHQSYSETADIEPARQIAIIKKVRADGSVNRQVSLAWKKLSRSDPSLLTDILTAVDSGEPLSANWLRSAVDAIAERALANGLPLPVEELKQFVKNSNHDPRARRLAFEWLARYDNATASHLIPKMLHDPSVEMRRDAVDRVINEARSVDPAREKQRVIQLYRKALNAARDEDQIKEVTKQLRSLGQEVNLPRHFGFIMRWDVIGPFDNTRLEGLDTVYPPEKSIDLSATYQGKDGSVEWQNYVTNDPYGMVDFNEPFGRLKETVAYARAEFVSDEQRDVELRVGCKNAFKVWFNGELLFSRNEYHRGISLDQYRMTAPLRLGKNEILVKACQNEVVEDWTVQWGFQLRVCDATGTAILSENRPGS